MAEEKKAEPKELSLVESARELAGAGIEVQVVVSKDKDSITIGAPSAGQIKVHGNFSRPQSFGQKVEVAQKLLADAKARDGASKNVPMRGKV